MLDQINIEDIKAIAINAAEAIMEVYVTDFEVESKEDKSPLTEADKRANQIIIDKLTELYPDIPYISEEIKAMGYEERKNWEYAWLIDPLDGTKEFLKKNGEFTVNIALIHNGEPVLGVVQVPAKNHIYWAKKGDGAFLEDENGEIKQLKVNNFKMEESGLRLVCSRSHLSPEVEEYIGQFTEPETVSMGSSLKFMLLADDKADIYPRLAPTMEWDTGAAHAVLKEAGGKVIRHDNDEELSYNKENLLNPWFIGFGKVIE